MPTVSDALTQATDADAGKDRELALATLAGANFWRPAGHRPSHAVAACRGGGGAAIKLCAFADWCCGAITDHYTQGGTLAHLDPVAAEFTNLEVDRLPPGLSCRGGIAARDHADAADVGTRLHDRVKDAGPVRHIARRSARNSMFIDPPTPIFPSNGRRACSTKSALRPSLQLPIPMPASMP